jgi:hypothetical protein
MREILDHVGTGKRALEPIADKAPVGPALTAHRSMLGDRRPRVRGAGRRKE